jgi:hypothetical protein
VFTAAKIIFFSAIFLKFLVIQILFMSNFSLYAFLHRHINPFQSSFSANRILPSSYLFWAGKVWWITCNFPRVVKEKNMEKKEV